jgi:hypothetical protein
MIEFKQGMNPYDSMSIGGLNNIKEGELICCLTNLYWLYDKVYGGRLTTKKNSDQRFAPGDVLELFFQKKIDGTIWKVFKIQGTVLGDGTSFMPLEWVLNNNQYFRRV